MSKKKAEDVNDRTTTTDINEFFGALDAGFFAEKIGVALTEIGLAVGVNGYKSKGKLVLTFEIKCADQDFGIIAVKHRMVKEVPKKNGKNSDEQLGDSTMYLARGGKIVEIAPPEGSTGQFMLPLNND